VSILIYPFIAILIIDLVVDAAGSETLIPLFLGVSVRVTIIVTLIFLSAIVSLGFNALIKGLKVSWVKC
jgi:hypothetical protein